MKIILHACCAPCSTHCIEELRENGYEPVIYFYNPNIHPKKEYEKRLEEVKKYCEKAGCELIIGEYEPDLWSEKIKGFEDEPEGGKRCEKCFELRLEKTAKLGNFTTTLTVSPYKNSKVILPILKKISERDGLEFLGFDFKKKDGYKKSIEISKNNNLYRQDYCGCVYSKKLTNQKHSIAK